MMMPEYWIPAAKLVSTALLALCFVIALILLNQQAAGRPRTFGLLGVTTVSASTLLHALNASLAGAYGRDTVYYAVGSVLVAVLCAAGLVLLALAVTRARATRSARGDH
jgi:hypothetical protein